MNMPGAATRAGLPAKTIRSDEDIGLIRRLRAMQVTLTERIPACAGDGHPDCPILIGLATGQRRCPSEGAILRLSTGRNRERTAPGKSCQATFSKPCRAVLPPTISVMLTVSNWA